MFEIDSSHIMHRHAIHSHTCVTGWESGIGGVIGRCAPNMILRRLPNYKYRDRPPDVNIYIPSPPFYL